MKQTFYAVKNNDVIKKNSSSGGVFYSLANYIISNNVIVYGAAYDNDFNVYHKKYGFSYIAKKYTNNTIKFKIREILYKLRILDLLIKWKRGLK